MSEKQIKGEIVVTSRIVDYLSSGLYASPAACLKELINNSYDADATDVKVFVKPDANRIIISDNGTGMDSSDFKRNFSRISESFKRSNSEVTATDRPKIGKIGIGFIAANEICDVMQVISTKKGSTEKIDVEINFKMMRESTESRRRDKSEFAQADFFGGTTTAAKSDHYTHVFLKEVKGPARDFLEGIRQQHKGISLYGKSFESIAKSLLNSNIRSWEDLDFYTRTMLEVALNVPVPYVDNWCTTTHSRKFADFTNHVQLLGFNVQFDGTELRKPTIFSPDIKSITDTAEYSGRNISFRTYFYAQHGTLKPENLNGVLIRIRNSAIGEYNRDFLGYPSSQGTLFQKWISSEIWADDRLEDAMNINRRSMRITHPSYVEMVDAYHNLLEGFISKVRKSLYEAPAAQKRVTRARTEINSITKQLESAQIRQSVPSIEEESFVLENQKAILRKFSTSELFKIVVQVAQELLPPKLREEFVQRILSLLLKK